MIDFDLGTATVSPNEPFIAGEYATITYSYITGHPIDDTGFIKIVFRYAGDFGTPQFDDPLSANYCSIKTSGNCHIEARWDPKGHTRPWGFAIYLKVMGGYLNTGDYVNLTFGDTTHGSPGWQMQTFCEKTFEFKTLIDPIASYQFKEIPVSPTIEIIPGDASQAVCIAPSNLVVNTPFTYYLKVEDRWGNPILKPNAINHTGFNTQGIYKIQSIDPSSGLSAVSNPIRVSSGDAPRKYLWADFHGQSEETIGSNSIDDYFTFARDYARLDIAAHQGNDFQISDEFWDKINQTTKKYYNPGKFVTFPGYEWSGNTPLGGDRNIYFSSEGGKITRSSNELLPDQASIYPVSNTADELFRNLKEQKNVTAFAFAHVGGRYADLSMHDPDIEMAVEIHSDWGTFEWLLEDALSHGYQIGICANSDGHKGRPGASYPGASKFGAYGGLTCVLADDLDRESVITSLCSRHFYATTGNRLLMELNILQDNKPIGTMGDQIKVRQDQSISLDVKISGTSPIESVDIFNGSDKLITQRSYIKNELGKRIKILWRGAKVRGRNRKVCWDGSLAVPGNKINDFEPINFWNPDQLPEKMNPQQINWQSITTGGCCGMLLTLDEADTGMLEVNTIQGKTTMPIKTIDIEPQTVSYGGLGKQIEIYRLPDELSMLDFSFTYPLTKLRKEINPIYIRVQQMDGHMAWISPVFITLLDS